MNKKRLPIFLFLLFVFVQASTTQAQPGCPYFSPEYMLERFNKLFIGKVLEVMPVSGKRGQFNVQVLENLKGTEDNSPVVVDKVFDGCTDSFRVGETYLFVGDKNEDGIFGAWSYSGEPGWKNQREYIEALRWKTSAKTNGLIVGTVLANNFFRTLEKQKPFNLDKIFLRNEQGIISEAKIEQDGHYRFENLKPARYSLFLDLPKGLKTQFGNASQIVEIQSNSAQIRNFDLLFDSSISGKVENIFNEPLKSMRLTLYRIDKSNKEIEIANTDTDKNGKYEFNELLPGRYIILTYPVKVYEGFYQNRPNFDPASEYSPGYFAAASKLKEAQVIKLKVGEKFEEANISIKIFAKRLIEGRVLYSDGNPVINADVTYYVFRKILPKFILQREGFEIGEKTDGAGDFSFYGFENTKYKIQAIIRNSHKSPGFWLSSDCVELPSNGEVKKLKLVLGNRDPGCSGSQFKYPL